MAFQIAATRDKRGWTQARLAKETGMTQNNISRLENPEYGKHTITSLQRIADALDVALVVRMVPFSQYIDWLSGTPYLDDGLRPEALAVPGFEDEEKSGVYEETFRFHKVYLNTTVQPDISSKGRIGNHHPIANGTYLPGVLPTRERAS